MAGFLDIMSGEHGQIRPIFVVGAARSGTHLLANLLQRNLPKLAYVSEINHVWLSMCPQLTHDQVTPELLDTQELEMLRDKIVKTAGGDTIWLEKTAANVLRPKLIHRLFPEARIIHIIRDGRDVALSLRRKAAGDLRKITRVEAEKKHRCKDVVKAIGESVWHKIKSGLSLRMLIHRLPRYINSVLAIAGFKKESYWGPRFPGYENYMKTVSHLELYARQWKFSYSTMREYAAVHPDLNYIELRFEDLIRSPAMETVKILEFLGCGNPSSLDLDLIQSVTKRTWREILSSEEKACIADAIESDLIELGYPETHDRHRSGSPPDGDE